MSTTPLSVTTYGCVGDAKTIGNITITNASTTITMPDTSQHSFTAGDIGKIIVIQTGESGTEDAVRTITATPTTTSATIDSATHRTGTTANRICLLGTDNKVNLQAAHDAACQARSTLVFEPDSGYLVRGSITSMYGSSFKWEGLGGTPYGKAVWQVGAVEPFTFQQTSSTELLFVLETPGQIGLDVNGWDGSGQDPNGDDTPSESAPRFENLAFVDVLGRHSSGRPGFGVLLRIRNCNMYNLEGCSFDYAYANLWLDKGDTPGTASNDASWGHIQHCRFREGFFGIRGDVYTCTVTSCGIGSNIWNVMWDQLPGNQNSANGLRLRDGKMDVYEQATTIIGGYTNSATSIQVSKPTRFIGETSHRWDGALIDSGTGLIGMGTNRAGEGMYAMITQANGVTGEVVYVSDVQYGRYPSSSGTLTVTRGVMGTAASALTDGWQIRPMIMGVRAGNALGFIDTMGLESTSADTLGGNDLTAGSGRWCIGFYLNDRGLGTGRWRVASVNCQYQKAGIWIVNADEVRIEYARSRNNPTNLPVDGSIILGRDLDDSPGVISGVTIDHGMSQWSTASGGEPAIHVEAGVSHLAVYDYAGTIVDANEQAEDATLNAISLYKDGVAVHTVTRDGVIHLGAQRTAPRILHGTGIPTIDATIPGGSIYLKHGGAIWVYDEDGVPTELGSGSSTTIIPSGSAYLWPLELEEATAVANTQPFLIHGGTAAAATGTSTQTPGAVATVTIPHGLSGTPAWVEAQPGNANARAAPAYYLSANASNLTLNFASNLTPATSYSWIWRAEPA